MTLDSSGQLPSLAASGLFEASGPHQLRWPLPSSAPSACGHARLFKSGVNNLLTSCESACQHEGMRTSARLTGRQVRSSHPAAGLQGQRMRVSLSASAVQSSAPAVWPALPVGFTGQHAMLVSATP